MDLKFLLEHLIWKRDTSRLFLIILDLWKQKQAAWSPKFSQLLLACASEQNRTYNTWALVFQHGWDASYLYI